MILFEHSDVFKWTFIPKNKRKHIYVTACPPLTSYKKIKITLK